MNIDVTPLHMTLITPIVSNRIVHHSQFMRRLEASGQSIPLVFQLHALVLARQYLLVADNSGQEYSSCVLVGIS